MNELGTRGLVGALTVESVDRKDMAEREETTSVRKRMEKHKYQEVPVRKRKRC